MDVPISDELLFGRLERQAVEIVRLSLTVDALGEALTAARTRVLELEDQLAHEKDHPGGDGAS